MLAVSNFIFSGHITDFGHFHTFPCLGLDLQILKFNWIRISGVKGASDYDSD